MKKALKYLFPLVIGLALLRWVFKDVDLVATISDFKSANYFLVFLALVVALLAHVSRAYRWNLMLEPMGYKPSLLNTSVAVMIGYLTNLIFPRAGELARSASLQKSENVPFDKSFGAVIAERVIDVLVLGVLVLVNILLEFSRLKSLVIEMFGGKLNSIQNLVYLGIGFLVFVGIAYFVFLKYKDKILNINLVKKIFEVGKGLWSGFVSVLKIKKSGLFFLHTLFIWSMYYLGTYLLCQAISIGQELSFLAVLTILVMGSIGMAIPTQGGLGSYHFFVGKIVVLYGLSQQDGVSLATFLHTLQGVLFVLLFGLAAFIISFFTEKKTNIS
ncbi:MAG: flippase-like domain-containing protein [Cytophagaceae bacterium]|nr:flippase-like domain-containing protein [Cytophagaceae bacterium]